VVEHLTLSAVLIPSAEQRLGKEFKVADRYNDTMLRVAITGKPELVLTGAGDIGNVLNSAVPMSSLAMRGNICYDGWLFPRMSR